MGVRWQSLQFLESTHKIRSVFSGIKSWTLPKYYENPIKLTTFWVVFLQAETWNDKKKTKLEIASITE